jgi:hypothetical protein
LRKKLEGTQNASFPVTMGVNAFRGFLDEFIKHKRKDRKDDQVPKKTRRRDRAKRDIYVSNCYFCRTLKPLVLWLNY